MGFGDAIRSLFRLKKTPVYELDRAVIVVFANLSPENQRALDHEDIDFMLKQRLRYEEEVLGPTSASSEEATIDDAELYRYIQEKAKARGKSYSDELIDAVMTAEVVYLRKAGIIDDGS